MLRGDRAAYVQVNALAVETALSEERLAHDGLDGHGVLSVRDVLLAGQRVELTPGNWAVLRGSPPSEFELAAPEICLRLR